MVEITTLKKHELEDLRKSICKELKKRYNNHRPSKYGDLNRTFRNQEELDHFLSCVHNPHARLIFQLQAYLGLRISEACKIKMEDLDLQQRRLWVRSAKDSIPSSMYLHDRIFTAIIQYLSDRNWRHQTYLFPSRATENSTVSRWPYLSPDWAKNRFTEALEKAGLKSSYAESEESYDRKPRKLQRLSTHSLRRWFIQHVHQTTSDLMLTQKLARHRNIRNTMIYLHADQNKVDRILEETFIHAT